MSEILVGWWWSFWNFSALISFLVKGGYRDKALCFSPKNQHMVPSSSPWNKKEENPVVIFRLLFPLLFVAPSDDHVDSLPNTGRGSACTDTLPETQEQWGKGHWCLFIGGVAISFLFFFAQQKTVPLFPAATLSSAKQKKQRQKVLYVLPGFHSSFLANPLLQKKHWPHLPL